MNKSQVSTVTRALVVLGALVWGLVGLVGVNLVSTVFGTGTIERVVYILVGLAGLIELYNWFAKK